MMLRGLQAGFGEPLGTPLLMALADRGVALLRLDLQTVLDPARAALLVAEVQTVGLRPLLIIRPEQAGWLPIAPALDVEILNEPDLAGWSPSGYANVVTSAVRVLAPEHRIWAGSLSNCSKRSLGWLAQVLPQLPACVGVTVHRYPKNGGRPSDGQEGFKNRLDELAAVRRIVGARPWGCTEFGYHTGPQQTGWWLWRKRWRWTEEQVAGFTAMEWQFWEQAGAAFAVWYQLNDGRTSDPVDLFGLRRLDGSWKPVAATFRRTP